MLKLCHRALRRAMWIVKMISLVKKRLTNKKPDAYAGKN